ncbi:hypothetical protein JHK86_006320 [Glycine max]|nr:hypothetical protein JHK86_006318 [Glycine max]KAG5071109.1 hypothetical protein JHK86_006320 [Glycine max]
MLDHARGHALQNNCPKLNYFLNVEKMILKLNHQNTRNQLLTTFLCLEASKDLQPSTTRSSHSFEIHNLSGIMNNKQSTVLDVEGDNDN